MKKRVLSLLLALSLSLAVPSLAAAAEDTRLETIRVAGIMVGDENGDMALTRPVTRAEFVKMMTAASAFQDSVGGYGSSLFKDVKSGHWASAYIKLAVEQGWFNGYVDGTFRPDNPITLEEACTALLRLLGYDASALTGSFPAAQLSKAGAIGLLDGLSAVQGQQLTRGDCVILFYDLLTVENGAGQVYGATLGYTVTGGEVDYASLVTADLKGPYVAESAALSLPFSGAMTVYRDGSLSALSAVERYDVYYYNANLRTVWVYHDRVTGTLSGVAPSRVSPTAVTVAGNTYTVGTSSAAYQLSSQGGFPDGQTVTLLLGMNGEVVEVLSAQESEGVYYGVVSSSAKAASTDATATSSSAAVQVESRVTCTDGVTRAFYHTGSALSAGKLVEVTVGGSGAEVKSLTDKTLTGAVSKDATQLSGYAFADGVEILDTDGEGNAVKLYPSRLAGAKLASGDVRYYTLDQNGAIDRLILNEATGDTMAYVYLTAVRTSGSLDRMDLAGSYTYLQDGETRSLSGSVYDIKIGGAALLYDDGALKNMKQLTLVKLTGLDALSAMADNKKYLLADDLQVYLYSGGSYYATTLDQVNAEDFTLKGWYDDLGCAAGGRIRILIATPA